MWTRHKLAWRIFHATDFGLARVWPFLYIYDRMEKSNFFRIFKVPFFLSKIPCSEASLLPMPAIMVLSALGT